MPPPPGLPPVDTAAVWSDAAVWVPWALYEAYGDHTVLERQYDSMCAHVRRVASKVSANGAWDTGFQFGDWLDPDALAGDRLAGLVVKSGHRISTGFAGTPYVCEALARTGHLEDAFALLQQRECPSWLYPVTMGATTVWERWDSMLPDGSINQGEMTSFNHYPLGAVADWMHRTVAGIAPLEPGYDKVLFAPRPGGDLTWAAASLETRHGLVAIRWSLDEGVLSVETTLPSGVSGMLSLPDGTEREIGAGMTRVDG